MSSCTAAVVTGGGGEGGEAGEEIQCGDCSEEVSTQIRDEGRMQP